MIKEMKLTRIDERERMINK